MTPCIAAKGYHVIKCVAVVDIHAPAHRPDTVSRIEVTVHRCLPVPSPHALINGLAYKKTSKVVQVTALTVQQFAEHAFVDHVYSSPCLFQV
ncbi:MAG: hypothetical protein JRI72_13685 [Deltaproteobacteria bacterium]|nr:hypothetical protein [Deltaproteobacteria bacterium]